MPSTVVRDSAGIRIVENSAPRWRPGEEWRLSAEPVVDIGGIDVDPSQELFGVTDAIRLRNGDIVIANNGTGELRFFDSTGVYRFSAGRKGEGPGEFAFLGWVRPWRGDSVVARSSGRLSFFDGSGAFGRLVTVRVNAARFSVAGIFPDGSMLGVASEGPRIGTRLGMVRRTDRLLHIAPDGESFADSVGWAPGMEMFYYRHSSGTYYGSILETTRRTWYAVRDDTYYVATNDTYEIKVYSLPGVLRTVIRKRQEDAEVTAADIDALRQTREESLAELQVAARQAREEFYEAAPLPERWPAFGKTGTSRAIHIDALANIWVEEYDRPWEEHNRWTVFDANGVLLGTMELPPGFEPRHIGADYVLGRWRDELDVEHVRMYDLIKSADEAIAPTR